MVKIELRDDGWFEIGEVYLGVAPMASVLYFHKQNLKKHLLSLQGTVGIGELDEALKQAPSLPFFDGKPYIIQDKVYINRVHKKRKTFLGTILD